MDDWQKLSLYSVSTLEHLREEAKSARMSASKQGRSGRLLVFFTAILLGVALWWIR